MNGWAVEYSPRARADLESLSAEVAIRIARRILELGTGPHPRGDTIKRIHGRPDTFRLRIGDYRAVFELDEAAHRVWVLRIVHRSQLDRQLKDLM